jgi:hypothetical protein
MRQISSLQPNQYRILHAPAPLACQLWHAPNLAPHHLLLCTCCSRLHSPAELRLAPSTISLSLNFIGSFPTCHFADSPCQILNCNAIVVADLSIYTCAATCCCSLLLLLTRTADLLVPLPIHPLALSAAVPDHHAPGTQQQLLLLHPYPLAGPALPR